jgi:hypothetical protein
VSASSVTFRIAYARYSELRDDVTQQMARGGLLVKVHDASGLTLDTPVQLELVLPDGTPPPPSDGPTRAEKIQKALHGNRDERNAILRDRDRTLHPFVLKNPQLNADDVVAIAKNAQVTPELLKQIGDRKDWFQRPSIALALARNPKTPPELAVRALEQLNVDTLRQIAKGTGVLPHVAAAARRKLLG